MNLNNLTSDTRSPAVDIKAAFFESHKQKHCLAQLLKNLLSILDKTRTLGRR